MCIIAAYVGPRPAVPVLTAMLKKGEGLAGGFYTGIATLHEGQLHHAKVVGDLNTLLQAPTGITGFPGSIGIIHSRTPNGGGQEWAHPFVDRDGTLAHIVNGARGAYADAFDAGAVAAQLEQSGETFLSAQREAIETYPHFPDGRAFHFSDLFAQATAARLRKSGESLFEAACEVYQSLPGEVVGVWIDARFPDEIVAVRYNKPLEYGRDREGGIYLASTRIVFPPEVQWCGVVPPMSAIRITRSGEVTLRPITCRGELPVGVRPSASAIACALENAIQTDGPQTMERLFELAAALYPEGVLSEKEAITFELLSSLIHSGKATLTTTWRPGMEEGLQAPLLSAQAVPHAQ